MSRALFATLVALIAPSCRALDPPRRAGERPNVVLVMTDDQGFGDAGYLGHPTLRTPHLDAAATAGLVFERFYAAAPVCSPTRASCLTGRHPERMEILGANVGHLPAGERTLAELLRADGYATGHFGKWHLGTLTRDVLDSNRGGRPAHVEHYSPPWEHGFETCFSTEAKLPTFDPMKRPGTDEPYGTAYWNEDGERVTENLAGDDSRVIVDRVLPFVRGAVADGRPFLAVVWFHTPHLPVRAGAADRAPYADEDEEWQHYHGALSAMDAQLGRLRAELARLGVERDTMLWFASDNGPEGGSAAPGSTGGLRGRKRSLHEGGVRVPGFVVWPARVAPGRTDVPASTSDYLPTVADALGLSVPPVVDGESLMDALADRSHRRTRGLGFLARRQSAWIEGTWKLYRRTPEEPYELYDLASDPAEARDLAGELPDVRERLVADLERWVGEVRADRGAAAAHPGSPTRLPSTGRRTATLQRPKR